MINPISKKQVSLEGLGQWIIVVSIHLLGLNVMAYPNVGDKVTFSMQTRTPTTFSYQYGDNGPVEYYEGDKLMQALCGTSKKKYTETQELTSYDSVTDTFDMKIDRQCDDSAYGQKFTRKIKRNDLFTPERAKQWIEYCLSVGGEMTSWGHIGGVPVQVCKWERKSPYGQHTNAIADMPFAWVLYEDYWGTSLIYSRRIE